MFGYPKMLIVELIFKNRMNNLPLKMQQSDCAQWNPTGYVMMTRWIRLNQDVKWAMHAGCHTCATYFAAAIWCRGIAWRNWTEISALYQSAVSQLIDVMLSQQILQIQGGHWHHRARTGVRTSRRPIYILCWTRWCAEISEGGHFFL